MTDNTATRLPTKLLVIGLIFALTGSLVAWLLAASVDVSKRDFEFETASAGKLVRQQFDTAIVRVKDLAAFVAAGMETQVTEKLSRASRQSPHIVELGYFYSDEPDMPTVFYTDRTRLDLTAGNLPELVRRIDEMPGLVTSFAGGTAGVMSQVDDSHLVMMQTLAAAPPLGLRLAGERRLVTYAIVDLRQLLNDAMTGLRSARFIEARITAEDNFRRLQVDQPVQDGWLTPDIKQLSLLVTNNTGFTLEFERSFVSSGTVVIFGLGILGLAAIAAALFFIAERRNNKVNARLRQAAEAERQANNAKSDFLATMSHEIRTPLNGVMGMAELLTRSSLSPTQKRYADQIKSSGGMLLGILNDILDMSKLESGKLAIDLVRMDLHAHLRETVSFYAATARQKGVSVLIDIDPDVPNIVDMDPMRLRQVISNLLSNAIKFSENGEVVVAASFTPSGSSDGTLTIAVTDSGIGIAPDELKRLFTRFSQANSGTTRKYGGTGLGLAISKQICEALGGSIGVESVPGEGSTFRIDLPVNVHRSVQNTAWRYGSVALVCESDAVSTIVGKALAAAGVKLMRFAYGEDLASRLVMGDEAGKPFSLIIFNEEQAIHIAKNHWQAIRSRIIPTARAIILGNMETNRNYLAFDGALVKPFLPASLTELIEQILDGSAATADPSGRGDEAGAEHTGPRFAGRRLLLVDDNHVNLLIGEEYLARYGFTISTATNGKHAVTAAEQGDFDVIFMDCQMPEMDGYEATGLLRQKMSAGMIRRVPIVALTANALKGDRERCLDAGMDDFLSKPLQDQNLIDVFDRLLDMPEFGWLNAPVEEPEAGKVAATLNAAPPAEVAASPATDAAQPRTTEPPRSVAPAVQTQTIVAPSVTKAPQPRLAEGGPPARASVAQQTPPPAATSARPAGLQPPAATSSGSTKVPLMNLVEFQRTRDAMTKFDLLISLYRTDTADYLKAIRQALMVENYDTAVLPAHTIKSSSRMVGASGLSALAENMETRLRTQRGASPAELAALIDKMDAAFDATQRQIDKLMEQPPRQSAM